MRPVVAARLADKVREYGHITTGFLGTPYICHVLSEWGYTDLAYMLLLRQQYPGMALSRDYGGYDYLGALELDDARPYDPQQRHELIQSLLVWGHRRLALP